VVVHTSNPSTWKAWAGEWKLWGQPGLHMEVKARGIFTATPCLQKQTMDTVKCKSACLACARPWVQSPALLQEKKKTERNMMKCYLHKIHQKCRHFYKIG
jgi:hypothetical protein